MRRGARLRLRDGVSLGYAEFGDPAGVPILFFHGIPGSRAIARALHQAALAHRARLLAVERPGCGLSDYWPARTVAEYSHVAVEAVDALGIGGFSVLGVSGGGPYALACGFLFPGRVRAIGIVSGVGGPEEAGVLLRSSRRLIALGRISPILPAFALTLARRIARRSPERMLSVLSAQLSEEGIAHPWAGRLLLADLLEAFSSGCRGVGADCARFSRWGFEPEEVRPPVHLWHGQDDRNVSSAAAERLARRLSDCRVRILPGEGHLSVLPRYGEEIVRALAA